MRLAGLLLALLVLAVAAGWAVAEDAVAAKPRSLAFPEAGATPLSALTAIAALAPAEGETVLVVGAAGGVGSFFVQLAAAAGANVVAPAFPEDHDYLRALGVGEIVDRNADVAAAGSLRVPIQSTYRLEQAGDALQALPSTHTRGKLVLTIA